VGKVGMELVLVQMRVREWDKNGCMTRREAGAGEEEGWHKCGVKGERRLMICVRADVDTRVGGGGSRGEGEQVVKPVRLWNR
jgi:hypothetical protein